MKKNDFIGLYVDGEYMADIEHFIIRNEEEGTFIYAYTEFEYGEKDD